MTTPKVYKTDKESLQALLDGKKLASAGWTGYIYLSKDGFIKDEVGHECGFASANGNSDLIEYQEPKWYDNIPEQGILCWVWDDNEEITLRLIKGYRAGEYYKFFDAINNWINAQPLTKEEVEQCIYNPDNI